MTTRINIEKINYLDLGNTFGKQNICEYYFLAVLLFWVCVYYLSPQGFLLSRMMPETCIRLQVNGVMLKALLQYLWQFPSSRFLSLSHFISKDEIPARRKRERKWYMMNDAAHWIEWNWIEFLYFKLAQTYIKKHSSHHMTCLINAN